MDPITVKIVDPQSNGISKEMVAAGAALAGAVVGGVIGWVSNWWTNRKADQRQKRQHKHDVEVLEKQLKEQREALELQARHEDRDRSVRLKLEKIERAYNLTNELDNVFILYKNTGHSETFTYIEKMHDLINSYQQVRFELYSIISLYLTELSDLYLILDRMYLQFELGITEFNEKTEELENGKLTPFILDYINNLDERAREFSIHASKIRAALALIIKDQNLIYSPPDETPTKRPIVHYSTP